MANSSGAVGSGPIHESYERAAFDHTPTAFHYRLSAKPGAVLLEFAKRDGSMKGTRELPYFVGSGATARSYLWADGGFFYEAPVAYYAAGEKWDLAPNYQTYAYPYLTRPAMPGCLSCHASFLNVVPKTQNRYASPPFAEGGIACERCHGSGEEHIRKMKTGEVAGGLAIVNPAKLAPDRRDSICSQCHLSGEVRENRAGQDWQSYHPGDRLDDSVAVFVRAAETSGMKVTSHMEKLALSACKRNSGDRLWCGTCHDPHFVPSASERVAWFRGKCLTCHDTSDCKESKTLRAARQDDCTVCHMAKSPVTDAQHVVYTDHSIPKRPHAAAPVPGAKLELVAFGGVTASARDTALAYGIAASRTTDTDLRARAASMLEQALRSAPNDVEILLYLAEIYRNSDREEKAIPLYRRAIQLDPAQVTGSVGLGGILMERGQYAQAISLWQDALSKNGGLELVRINMAMAQWRSGDLAGAESSLAKAVSINPGFTTPVDLLRQVREQIQKGR